MKDKNLLCISWCDADNVMNYGQILQALAMMMLLRKSTTQKIIYISYWPRSCKEKIRYIVKHLKISNGHLRAYIKTQKIIKRIVKENHISFFQIQNGTIPNHLIKNIDIFICGSDQIWHPQNYNKNYFLAFGDYSSKRIAYAASLPKSYIEEQYENQFKQIKEHLTQLDSIAVREQSSIPLISKLSKKPVISVLDPTYLIAKNVWETMIEPVNFTEEFIFVYIPNGMDKKMAEMVSFIKKQLSIRNVFIMITRGENYIKDATVLGFISLGEFLYLIKNAKCVITSSFHAVVFSTIFHTDFYVYDVKNIQRGEDCRLHDILKALNLSDRELSNETLTYTNIDFSCVDELIAEQAEKSRIYLTQNLE